MIVSFWLVPGRSRCFGCSAALTASQEPLRDRRAILIEVIAAGDEVAMPAVASRICRPAA